MTARTMRVSVILSLPIVAASQGVAQRAPTNAAIDARINALIAPEASAGRFSGIVLVARGDQIVMQRPYGFADWERRVPNSITTRFGIGSITKPITETLIDMLAADRRVDLDAPVANYLQGFPDGPKGGRATVRDLVNHRAGVPHRVTTEIEETEHFNPADIVERVKARGLLFEPGSQELYSSAGFTSLARIVELVEKMPFDSVLAERIFRPASMRFATDETGQQLMTGRALPYVLQGGPVTVSVASAPYKDLSFLTGAGSMFASAADLLHFVRAQHLGAFGSVPKKLLGDAGDTTWTGWYGRVNGYEASIDYLPASDLTIVLLSNLQSAANWQSRERIRDIVRGRAISAIAAVPAVAPPFEKVEEIVGLYGNPADPLPIEEKEGRIIRDGDEIYPISGGIYYEPVSGGTVRFSRDSTGKVEAMLTRFSTGAPRVAPRIRQR